MHLLSVQTFVLHFCFRKPVWNKQIHFIRKHSILYINFKFFFISVCKSSGLQILPLINSSAPSNDLNPIQDGIFRGCSRMEGGKNAPLFKICHTYPTTMKLGTVIPYPKKIQKIYESRDTPFEFCWHQHFFTENQQILLYQEIQI